MYAAFSLKRLRLIRIFSRRADEGNVAVARDDTIAVSACPRQNLVWLETKSMFNLIPRNHLQTSGRIAVLPGRNVGSESLDQIVGDVYNVYMKVELPISFTKSAFKHKITERQMREVLQSNAGEVFELGDDFNEDPCEMNVGLDEQNRLLEVGICYEHIREECIEIRVFHARKAQKEWINAYNERKRRQAQE